MDQFRGMYIVELTTPVKIRIEQSHNIYPGSISSIILFS